MAAFFERIAPLNHASKITMPLFVIQGGNDPRVPKSESEQMVAKLKAQGTHAWYLMAKDEGHGFTKKPNQDFEFYSTVMFIKKYLVGEGVGKWSSRDDDSSARLSGDAGEAQAVLARASRDVVLTTAEPSIAARPAAPTQ